MIVNPSGDDVTLDLSAADLADRAANGTPLFGDGCELDGPTARLAPFAHTIIRLA